MQEIAAEFGYTNSDNAKNQKYKCLIRLKKMFFMSENKGTITYTTPHNLNRLFKY